MPKWNGGVIGPANTPTIDVASGVWSLAEVEQYTGAGTWPVYGRDPYFSYTTLLLHGDGINGAQNNTFLDSSANNFTITRNGSTTQGTFSPFSQDDGKWGAYFDGSGDYLSLANETALQMSTGDFTVEFWFYPTNINSTNQRLISTTAGAVSSNDLLIRIENDNSLRILVGSTNIQPGSPTITANVWHHCAVVRSGGGTNNCSVYLDGTRIAQGTSTSTLSNGIQLIGGYFSTGPAEYFYGYMSNVRVLKGTALYTSNFTPPTSPLTAISGTSLLTCQSNRFVDNSANAFAITANGNTSIQPFSPFAPSAAYSAATNGGSGYFDGNGDYLTVPANAAFGFGTGDFTWESWLYITSSTTSEFEIWESQTSNAFVIYKTSSGASNSICYRAYGAPDRVIVAAASIPYNQWFHLAVARSSGIVKSFLNGVQTLSQSDTTNFATPSAVYTVAARNGGTNPLPAGYISNLRVVKGTAVYTSNFTPPAAPLTAIANTSLLLSFTNGGIFDSTARSVLETVGNAQISTSVKKFGTGSMYFDGSGDYLIAPASPDISLDSGDFTIECWLYNLGYSGSQYGRGFITLYSSASYSNRLLLRLSQSSNVFNMYFFANGAVRFGVAGTNSTASCTPNSWVYFTLVRQSGTFKLYVNGTLDTTISNVTEGLTNFDKIEIGRNQDGTVPDWKGYIDDLRITKGVARYTSNFTPPAEAFSDI